MINLSKLREYHSSNIQIEERFSCERLPLEIIEIILCFSNQIDLEQTILVSHTWCDLSIQIAKYKCSSLEKFIGWVNEHSNEKSHLDDKNAFTIKEIPLFVPFVPKSLKLLKNAFKILKELKISSIHNLKILAKDDHMLNFIENIFDLALIEKEIHTLEINPSRTIEKLIGFSKYIYDWNKIDQINDLLIWVYQWDTHLFRFGFLREMAIECAKSDLITKSIEIAKKSSDQTTFNAILETLITKGKFDSAFTVFEKAPDHFKKYLYAQILNALVNQNHIKMAFEIANDNSRGKKFWKLDKVGEFGKRAFKAIFNALVYNDNLGKLTQIRAEIHPDHKNSALKALSSVFLKHNDFHYAIECANLINDTTKDSAILRNGAFYKIALKYFEKYNLPEALKITKEIDNPHLQEKILYYMCEHTTHNSHTSYFTLPIPYLENLPVSTKDRALFHIVEGLLTRNYIGDALRTYNLITEKTLELTQLVILMFLKYSPYISLDIANESSHHKIRTNFIRQYAIAQIKQNNIKEVNIAVDMLVSGPEFWLNEFALKDISELLIAYGHEGLKRKET